MKKMHYIWRLVQFRPWLYLAEFVLKTFVFCVYAQLLGLLYLAFFNILTQQTRFVGSAWLVIIGVALLPIIRAILVTCDVAITTTFSFSTGTLLRRNLFEQILHHPEAQAITDSPGESISRIRDDVDLIIDFMEQVPFLVGYLFFGVFSLIVMMRINAVITCLALLPMVGVLLLAKMVMQGITKYRQVSRKAAGEVTSFTGEIFSSVQAIKIAGAEQVVLKHFQELSNVRRIAAVKDDVFNSFLQAVFANAVSLGTGSILLAAGQAIYNGSFTIGDFALFAYYMSLITVLINRAGAMLAKYKQAGVSLERLIQMLQDAVPETLVRKRPLNLHGEFLELPFLKKKAEHILTQLETKGLTYHYPSTGRGIDAIDLCLKSGSLTVITGRIGSGKTTLLRVLSGLINKEAGEIYWNGESVEHPAAFFTPPRSAYTAQVPTLFSDTVKDNILMGLPEDRVDLHQAILLAVMEQDLAEMADGVNTMIGRKGVKLSGGQIQRIAAARMFVRNSELLIFDDLSSALDVETEKLMWEHLFAHRNTTQHAPTYLVVSHRQSVLQQADHILVLKNGRVEAEGTLDVLLVNCLEMQQLCKKSYKTVEEGS